MTNDKIIIDEDWGSDAMEVASILLANPTFSILGATVVFGNTGQTLAIRNAGAILHFLNADNIPYFPGAHEPSDRGLLEGDGAHGADGIGGINLLLAPTKPQTQNAVDFILSTLKNEPPQTVTIIAAAPLTNIAQAIQRDPKTMRRVKRIISMGGCMKALPAHDRPERKGNITPFAEFNFYMAANDANIALNSGIPITLFPMDCTHQLTLTPEREKIIRDALPYHRYEAEMAIGMMQAPTEIDRRKFDICPVLHDVHTAAYLVNPEFYEGQRGIVDVVVGGEAHGRSDFHEDPQGNVLVMQRIKNPDDVFNLLVSSFRAVWL